MRMQRVMMAGAALAAVLTLAAATGTEAQGRPLFQWQGRVDREVRLVLRGRDLNARTVDRVAQRRVQERVFGALPREAGRVVVRVQDGRGAVDVVQQPDRRNEYTAVIRIRDPRSGADDYRLVAYWQPVPDRYDRAGKGGDAYDRRVDGRGDVGSQPERSTTWYAESGNRLVEHGQLHWTGLVDDEVDIRVEGDHVTYVTRRGTPTRQVRAELQGRLPRQDVQVHVDRLRGRGNVTVVQQPSRWNGYTAVLRVRDARAGADRYQLDVSW